jgi:NAD(P)-dependent dehydrogenase (short-subunit alcohol dehydrogenase family)
MSSRFENKVVVITGGNSGIGLATARAFKDSGASVVVTGRDETTLEQARADLGDDALVLKSDAASVDAASELVAAVKERFGRIDILFVNAGVAKFAGIEEASEELYDQTFGINLRGPYFLIQKSLPLLGEGSSIIFNATALIDVGMPGASIYAASKAALASLAKTLAAELAGRGIRVNVVNPGPISTPIYGRMGMTDEQLNGMSESIRQQVPLQRFGEPEDIASAVLYLAGAHFVTGNELFVDGGFSRV